jgi:probable blue pigment (indigoidine) exporter
VSTSGEGKRGLRGTRVEGLALVLFTACSWGLAWPTSKFLLTMLPPYSMRGTSGCIGCALAFMAAAVRRETIWPPRDQWARLFLFAMFNYGLFIVLTTQAIARLKASEAVTITYTIPVWSTLLAWPMLKERPTPIKLLALVLALGGVALLVGADPAEASTRKLFPAALALGAAVLFGLGTVLAKQRPLRMPPAAAVAWQALIGMAVVVAFAVPETRDWSRVSWNGWAGLLYIAVIPMLLAYLAWFRALRLVAASTAATTVLISPLVGVIGSGLMLHETFGVRQITALVMTLVGIALAARG